MQQPLKLALSSLSDTDRAAWSASLDAYSDFAKLNLIFDRRLITINNALTRQEGEGPLQAGFIEPDALAALNRAAPIYRKTLWVEHRKTNEEWIARISPLVEQHAVSLIAGLTKAYRVSWPNGPIIVDASNEAGPNLAYTTDGPDGTAAHATIVPDKNNDLAVAFETVFHEASHSIDSQIVKYIDEEAAKQKVKPHKDLWHGIIFFTVGELVKRELHKENDPSYKPYAYRFGVYDRGWQKIRDGLERDWQPYLDGKLDFNRALASLVADCSTPSR